MKQEIAMYIDIEGFTSQFESGGKHSFIELTNDIYKLGKEYFRHLSFYQFGGDGFLIKEILTYSNDLQKFIDIGTALLQSILIKGGIGRVQISMGNIADITGLYTQDIQKAIFQGNCNILGDYQNAMLINPVIGTAIINCFKLKGPSGPLLLIDKSHFSEVQSIDLIHYNHDEFDVYGVNWLKHKSNCTTEIIKCLNLDDSKILDNFDKYLAENTLSQEWMEGAKSLINNSICE